MLVKRNIMDRRVGDGQLHDDDDDDDDTFDLSLFFFFFFAVQYSFIFFSGSRV
jgi:hypothetical protein